MRISIVLFDGFELLDAFGPAELFSFIEDWDVEYLAPTLEPVASAQGVKVLPNQTYAALTETDLLLIPGGRGTRVLIKDENFIEWLKTAGSQAKITSSVCTGSALLAHAGLLENHRATSNKRAFAWASSFGENVTWEPSARWVHSENRWTSSGIAAGIDMAAALIAELKSPEVRDEICERAEIKITKIPENDPFAAGSINKP
ncbi:DJ-1/PfpI family protein [uncultured Rothia sp.]|uniref:DJ-1/PfpI family protein n=1 Tax=uncultured Rothia sp. TaxID=316088 RepID=UPI00321695AA